MEQHSSSPSSHLEASDEIQPDKQRESVEEISKRNKHIRLADRSPSGWAVVAELEGDDIASGSEKNVVSKRRRAKHCASVAHFLTGLEVKVFKMLPLLLSLILIATCSLRALLPRKTRPFAPSTSVFQHQISSVFSAEASATGVRHAPLLHLNVQPRQSATLKAYRPSTPARNNPVTASDHTDKSTELIRIIPECTASTNSRQSRISKTGPSIDQEKHIENSLPDQSNESSVEGSKFGYHSLTYGLYVDTLAKKVDPKHRNISQIFHEDIAVPFDIDFFIGVPKPYHHRMARVYPITLGQAIWRSLTSGDRSDVWRLYHSLPISGSDGSKVIDTFKEIKSTQNFVNDPDKASVGVTSYSGFGTARGMAKLCCVLANGGSYKGKQLLSFKLISKLSSPLVDGIDETVQEHLRFGPGTFLSYNPQGQTIFGSPGFGAQLGFADPNNGLSFAYCTNHLGIHHFWNDPIILKLQSAIYEGVKSKVG